MSAEQPKSVSGETDADAVFDAGTQEGRAEAQEESVPLGQAMFITEAFHATYERLAPDFGYRTREASAVEWDQVPKQNRDLMVAVVRQLLRDGVIR